MYCQILTSRLGEKTQKILAHNGFKGKVQVKLIKKVFLDSDGIYVDYTYSEDTYDNQTISLDSQLLLTWTGQLMVKNMWPQVITGKATYNQNL